MIFFGKQAPLLLLTLEGRDNIHIHIHIHMEIQSIQQSLKSTEKEMH